MTEPDPIWKAEIPAVLFDMAAKAGIEVYPDRLVSSDAETVRLSIMETFVALVRADERASIGARLRELAKTVDGEVSAALNVVAKDLEAPWLTPYNTWNDAGIGPTG